MTEQAVLFEPTDVLQFRDGRPFDAGADALARSWPMPSPASIAGAVVAAVGRQVRKIRGPIAATWSAPDDVTCYLPAPLDLVCDNVGGNKAFMRLTWNTEVTADHAASDRCVGPTGIGDPTSQLISVGALGEYLAGRPLSAIRELGHRASGPGFQARFELRTGVAIGDTHDRSGFLYAGQFVRTVSNRPGHRHAGYAAVFRSEHPASAGTVRLGGEGGHVSVMSCDTARLGLPSPPTAAPAGLLFVYLATPAIFARGWMPPLRNDIELVGACMAGPEPLTGGSPGRWWVAAAVPAGSVYLLRFKNEQLALEYAGRVHGSCLTQANDDLARRGFGLCFTGGVQ